MRRPRSRGSEPTRGRSPSESMRNEPGFAHGVDVHTRLRPAHERAARPMNPGDHSPGSPRAWPSDRRQIVAYAVLLEEAFGQAIPEGRVRYHAANVTVRVPIDDAARAHLAESIAEARRRRETAPRSTASTRSARRPSASASSTASASIGSASRATTRPASCRRPGPCSTASASTPPSPTKRPARGSRKGSTRPTAPPVSEEALNPTLKG